MREFLIDGVYVSDGSPAYCVSEIGHNHGGDIAKAIAMIRSAKVAGASAVKFQTRNPKRVYQQTTERGAYLFESDNPQWMDRVYGVHREKLEPTWDEWVMLSDEAKRIGITMFSTPFDMDSLALLERLGMPAYKVASGDATNIPLIREIARTGKPAIISTGGCSQEEVDRLYDAFRAINGDPKDLAILQCSCVYPATDDAMNLKVIETYRARYPDTVIGLSTHHQSAIPSLAAFVLGARIFEHHYTNDRTWKGTDNAFSLDTAAMKEFVASLAQVQKTLGDSRKFRTETETKPTLERRKKLVWARQVMEFGQITADDLTEMCPAWDGIEPRFKDSIIGQHVAHTTGAGETVQWIDIMAVQEREAARA